MSIEPAGKINSGFRTMANAPKKASAIIAKNDYNTTAWVSFQQRHKTQEIMYKALLLFRPLLGFKYCFGGILD
jgi:hypothetical protein